MNTTWYQPLRNRISLGSTAARPGSLAGLHQARREHLGQFFTSDALAALLWRIASPAMDAALARKPGSRVALLDTSVGAGRLLQFASPDQHTLAGADVHGPSVQAVADVAVAAGFECDFVQGSLEGLRPRGFGVALLNPPFGLHCDSPLLRPLPSTGWGRFGPRSAAVLHAYAVDQAVEGADVVLAILPTPYAQSRAANEPYPARLRACIRLPAGSFRDEGTEVDVSLLVYGPARTVANCQHLTLTTLDESLPALDLQCANTSEATPRPLNLTAIEASAPSILGSVTGDPVCRVSHSGRKITLTMSCAFTKARVLNEILRSPVHCGDPTHRYPASVRYSGQGALDLEAHLAQDDPEASFAALLATIRAADAVPVVNSGLFRHLRKRIRLRERQRVPLRHVVKGMGTQVKDGATFTGTALKHRQINSKRWGSGLVRQGETHPITFTGQHYELTHPTTGEVWRMDETEARAHFTLDLPTGGDEWTVLHAGRRAAFPEIERAVRGRMRQAGVHRATDWPFQLDDICEASIAPGAVCTAQMGCGKTRILLGLALLGGKRVLQCLDAHLIDEFCEQIREIGLDPSEYQVITTPEQCEPANLRRINIIAYSRLRMEICPGAGRRTYARLLRRRVSRVLCDEAHLLRNYDSAQSRAVWQLSPRSRIAATGTPIANYPRDLMPLCIWAAGDGTANQPYGRFHPQMEIANVRSMDHAEIGAQRFMLNHSVYEWVTHEHVESGLRSGAKREIPRVNNLQQLRDWAAPMLMRRVTTEPEVAQHFHIPSSEIVDHEIGWDPDHLAWFLRVADDFADYYKQQRREANAAARNVNFISLLARIGNVARAGTFPQHGVEGFGAHTALTSKQRAVLDRCETLTHEGHKTIVFVDQPANVELFVKELASRGIEAVPFHGELPIVARTRAMNDRFRRGPAPVMVATLGCAQTGLNLYCASRALYAVRDWTVKAMRQSMGRLMRPQQTQHVVFEFFTLVGSLDSYMKQMNEFKADATDATLDFLTPELDDAEFLHLDAFIDSFVEDLATRAQMKPWEFRKQLKERVAA